MMRGVRRGFVFTLLIVFVVALISGGGWWFSGDLWEWFFWGKPRYQIASINEVAAVARLNTHTGSIAIIVVTLEGQQPPRLEPAVAGYIKGPGSQ